MVRAITGGTTVDSYHPQSGHDHDEAQNATDTRVALEYEEEDDEYSMPSTPSILPTTATTTTTTTTTSPQSFTPRSLIVGLLIGTLITFSNTYFGLQTGWISTMAMPSALIGFSIFKALSKHLSFPFTPIENVLIQTVAGAVGTMPLGCGFVGVIPALEFLLKDGNDDTSVNGVSSHGYGSGSGSGNGIEIGPLAGGGGEGGPLRLSFWNLVLWSLGVCLFGVVFAVPLRKEVIIREKLRFPSGTASALMLKVLHGTTAADEKDVGKRMSPSARVSSTRSLERRLSDARPFVPPRQPPDGPNIALTKDLDAEEEGKASQSKDWRSKMRLLIGAFFFSGAYTLFSYFVPQVRDLPIFGLSLATTWLWTLNPSPAYVGQGIIMGPSTCMHMLFGAVVGWGILSPLAKAQGWAPGPVDDWENGSKGWIVWVSLAIMLADSLVSLGWLVLKPLLAFLPRLRTYLRRRIGRDRSKTHHHDYVNYSTLSPIPIEGDTTDTNLHVEANGNEDEDYDDAPPSELISTKTILFLLPLTLLLNVLCMHIVFGELISPLLSSLATLLALLLSIMGVRALGETDLNPVSGISKLTQLIFSLFTPASHFSRRTALVTNLLAGAVSESGALQAGDLMQDLKTGHLVGASPKAQFYGQIIGSLFGAVLSTAVYKMYVNVYEVPGNMFQVPTAYVWIFTARLVTGQGLPRMAGRASLVAGVVFVFVTVVRVFGASAASTTSRGGMPKWRAWVPGGIAVAVGTFNVPSFTLARAIGGLIAWWWSWKDTKRWTEAVVELNPFYGGVPAVAPQPASSSSDARMTTATASGNGNPELVSQVSRGLGDEPQTEPPAAGLAGEGESEGEAVSSTVVVLASGLILGEGIVSIVNLLLASGKVPHL